MFILKKNKTDNRTETSLLLTVVIIYQAAGWLATMSFIKSHICNIFTKDETENKIVKMQKHIFFNI